MKNLLLISLLALSACAKKSEPGPAPAYNGTWKVQGSPSLSNCPYFAARDYTFLGENGIVTDFGGFTSYMRNDNGTSVDVTVPTVSVWIQFKMVFTNGTKTEADFTFGAGCSLHYVRN